VILMVKKVGRLKNVEDLLKVELEEGESVVVDGIENVKIVIERGKKKEVVSKP